MERSLVCICLIPELPALDHMLADLYTVCTVQFDVAGGPKEPRQLMFCTDILALFQMLSDSRE